MKSCQFNNSAIVQLMNLLNTACEPKPISTGEDFNQITQILNKDYCVTQWFKSYFLSKIRLFFSTISSQFWTLKLALGFILLLLGLVVITVLKFFFFRTEEERAIQAACDKKRKKRVRILFTNFQEIQESTKIYFRALCWNHVCWFPWTIKEALLYRIWKSQPRQLYSSKKTNSSSIPSWQFSKFSKKLHLFPLLQLQQWRLSSVTNARVCSKLKVVWRCT